MPNNLDELYISYIKNKSIPTILCKNMTSISNKLEKVYINL